MSFTQEQRDTLERMAVDLRAVLDSEAEESEPDTEDAARGKENPLWGIDVHPEYQAGLNFQKVKSESYSFAVIKASEGPYRDGRTYTPTGLASYIERAKSAGLIVGLYHFLVETPPKPQVEHFLRVVGGKAGCEGKLVMVDFEPFPKYPSLTPTNETLKGFLAELRQSIGEHPIIIYSSRTFWDGGNPSGPVANYGKNLITWDALWPYSDTIGFGSSLYKRARAAGIGWGKRWGNQEPHFWQFTPAASVAGMNVDGDAFRGSREQLLALTRSTQVVETEEGKKLAKRIEEFGEAILGTPYGIWESGGVPDEEPAWAKNAPAPEAEYVRRRSAFCIAPSNLFRRICELKIPYRPSIPKSEQEKYDGGTWAYQEFFRKVREPFKLTQANGKPWPPLTFFGRFWGGGQNLASEGHGAHMWFNGKLFQSFISNFETGAPGVNKGVSLKDSHNGNYYDYVVKREDIFGHRVAQALDALEEDPEALRLFAQAQEEESDPELLEAMRVYQRWTEGEIQG